jgi:hypothetical protein
MYDIGTNLFSNGIYAYFGSKGLIIQIMFSNGIYTYFGSKGLEVLNTIGTIIID